MNIAATGGFAGGGAGGILTGGGDQLRPLEDALNLVAPVGNPFALDPNASAPGNGGGGPIACPDFG